MSRVEGLMIAARQAKTCQRRTTTSTLARSRCKCGRSFPPRSGLPGKRQRRIADRRRINVGLQFPRLAQRDPLRGIAPGPQLLDVFTLRPV